MKDKTTLLIIDDCEDDLYSLNRFFIKIGCEVLTAPSGETGLDLAEIYHVNVALIDIIMPGLGGEDTLLIMKMVHPTIPIIMMTGCGDEQEAKKCMELGAYDYVQKPIDIEYLKTSVLSTEIMT